MSAAESSQAATATTHGSKITVYYHPNVDTGSRSSRNSYGVPKIGLATVPTVHGVTLEEFSGRVAVKMCGVSQSSTGRGRETLIKNASEGSIRETLTDAGYATDDITVVEVKKPSKLSSPSTKSSWQAYQGLRSVNKTIKDADGKKPAWWG